MRKPVNPGPEPTAKCDEVSNARGDDISRDEGPTRAKIRFAGSDRHDIRNDINLNDAWLVEHARRGDHDAFALLVRRYEHKLHRVLTRLIRDPEDARDLAQETFWRVYVHLPRFDTGRRFGPWLFRVAVNLGLDWIRHRKRKMPLAAAIDRTPLHDYSTFEIPDADPHLQVELAQEVQFILELMPVSYRTILVLRDLEGFSSSEVAAIIGRRESTVRWKLAIARDKFREIWDRRQDGVRREPTDGKTRGEHVAD
jgi:RNA polymerase sigma-70 factor, ECF subfamily